MRLMTKLNSADFFSRHYHESWFVLNGWDKIAIQQNDNTKHVSTFCIILLYLWMAIMSNFTYSLSIVHLECIINVFFSCIQLIRMNGIQMKFNKVKLNSNCTRNGFQYTHTNTSTHTYSALVCAYIHQLKMAIVAIVNAEYLIPTAFLIFQP